MSPLGRVHLSRIIPRFQLSVLPEFRRNRDVPCCTSKNYIECRQRLYGAYSPVSTALLLELWKITKLYRNRRQTPNFRLLFSSPSSRKIYPHETTSQETFNSRANHAKNKKRYTLIKVCGASSFFVSTPQTPICLPLFLIEPLASPLADCYAGNKCSPDNQKQNKNRKIQI